MEAGRELDALVAEKVMGLTVMHVPTAWTDIDWMSDDYPTERDCMAVINHVFKPGSLSPPAWVIPNYSTDIAAAWLVVGYMTDRYWCQVRTPFGTPWQDLDDGYWAGFTPHGVSGWNGTPDHWTSADTAPLAICLAALKAVGYAV